MTTLPNNANSIGDIIAAFSNSTGSTGDTTGVHFWESIVADELPGNASPAHIAQYARVKHHHQLLTAWCMTWHLPVEHVEESAFYATVTTQPDWDATIAEDLGKIILWIYVIDDYLDKHETPVSCETIQRQIDQIFNTDYLLPLNANVLPVPTTSENDAIAIALTNALRDLLTTLVVHWQMWRLEAQLPVLQQQRLLFVIDVLQSCVVAMLQEVRFNSLMAIGKTDHFPNLTEYLVNGQQSIGMLAVAAIATSYCPDYINDWSSLLPAIEVGGQIIRLCNDIHTYHADIAERKMTAVSLGLTHLGYQTEGLADTSAEVSQAKIWLCQTLSEKINVFSSYIPQFSENPLSYYLIRSVAFALAIYGDDTI